MRLSDDQFSNTLAALGCGNAAAIQENRSRGRVPMGTKATIIPCCEAGRGEVLTVVVVNISETGIGILNGVPMQVADHFILRLPATPRQTAAAVLCSVVYVQPILNGMYAIGAQFKRILVVKPGQPVEACPITAISDAGEQDLDHVREVESRLSQLSF